GMSVLVDIRPNGFCNESDMGQSGCEAVRDVGKVAVAVVEEQIGSRYAAVVGGNGAAADEQVRGPISVEIDGNDAGSVDIEVVEGQRVFMQLAFAVVEI